MLLLRAGKGNRVGEEVGAKEVCMSGQASGHGGKSGRICAAGKYARPVAVMALAAVTVYLAAAHRTVTPSLQRAPPNRLHTRVGNRRRVGSKLQHGKEIASPLRRRGVQGKNKP